MRARFLIRAATALICLPLLYFAAGFAGALIPGKHADLPAGTDVLIGLARAPIHYDFLLPMSPELRARYGFASNAGVPMDAPQAEWLLVGWGSEAFYTSAGSYGDMKPGAVWTAISGDSAVLHLDVAGDVSGLDGISYFTLSDAQYQALLNSLDANFRRDQTGAPLPLGAHFNDHDAFFEAKGDFSILHPCNAWLGETLRSAGVPFGIWTPTPQAVELSLRWYGQ
ncbi:urease-associated protein [Cypionkella aquatica]|uniref:Urease-associated protein n=1 Tax=Cypionkella aquatica TaxID=1756042 RepID=A0AA37U510_9RHOB|nr:TIGR02117 family protein [Cypionkella aquatica]GLS85811.1 urease-associated protein [Cypionkella aquatica]